MRNARNYILISSIFTALLLLLPATGANASCRTTRFIIEDEVSGQEIGLIYTDSNIKGAKDSQVCIEGEFLGKKYQYLYSCDEGKRYTFIKKFRSDQKGCKWGVIH